MATKCDIIYIVHQFSGLVLAYFLAARVLDFLKGTMSSTGSPAKVGSTKFFCEVFCLGVSMVSCLFLSLLFWFSSFFSCNQEW